MMTLDEARKQFPLKSTVKLNPHGRKVMRAIAQTAEVTSYSTLRDINDKAIVLLHVRYRDGWGRMKSYKVQAGLVEKADA